MRYARLYAGPDGVSHFDDVNVESMPVEYLPDEPMVHLAQPRAVSTFVFARLPAGWRGGQHRSPRSQFTIVLAGELEVLAGDGERRRFRPGGLYLSGDTTGTGHESYAGNDADCVLVIVPLAEES